MVIQNSNIHNDVLLLLQSAKQGKVVSPWRYPGGKSHVMKKHILPFIRKMNKTNEFNDPFAGGGCIPIALAKEYPTMRFRLNDKNPAMAEYWRIIASDEEPEILYKALETPMTREWYKLVSYSEPEEPQMRVYRALVLNRINWNGVQSSNPSKDFLARYDAKETTLRIRALRILFKDRLEIFNLDVLDFLKVVGGKAFVFLDPPYWQQGKNLYPTFMNPIEHKRLANSLKALDRKKMKPGPSDFSMIA